MEDDFIYSLNVFSTIDYFGNSLIFNLDIVMSNGFKRLKSSLKRAMNKDILLMGSHLYGAIYYNAYKGKYYFIKGNDRVEFNKLEQVWRHYEK